MRLVDVGDDDPPFSSPVVVLAVAVGADVGRSKLAGCSPCSSARKMGNVALMCLISSCNRLMLDS